MAARYTFIGLVCLLNGACNSSDPVDLDKALLAGDWAVVSIDTGGYLPWLEEAAKGGKLTFFRDEVILKNGRETKKKYRIRPAVIPKSIDLFDDREEAWQGIYSIEVPAIRV